MKASTGLANWMSNLPENVTEKPINKLYIPGSHNSFSYCINESSQLSPESPAYSFLKKLGPIGMKISSKWARTQDATLTEQLEGGIRYFDFRVILRTPPSTFFFVHGQFAKEVISELFNIRLFLRDNPKEIVLLDFNHVYEFNDEAATQFLQFIIKVFGSMLAPFTNEIPTLANLWADGHQVVAFINWSFDTTQLPPQFWPPTAIHSPWPDTTVSTKLLPFLEENPQSNANIFHVTQGILTPDLAYVMSHLESGLIVLAKPAGELIVAWLKTVQNTSIFQRNIFIIDFAIKMFPEYTNTVIELNASI